jgi:hypothetical protein
MSDHRGIDPAVLPEPLRHEAARFAARQGTSLASFTIDAVAARVAFLAKVDAIAATRAAPDWEAFDRIMNRESGEAPRDGDVLQRR